MIINTEKKYFINDYLLYVREGFEECTICKQDLLKLYNIKIYTNTVHFKIGCDFCGEEKTEKVQKEDLQYIFEQFCRKKYLPNSFLYRWFRLGLGNQQLFDTVLMYNTYIENYTKMLANLKAKTITVDGKRYRLDLSIPKEVLDGS